MRKHRIDGSVTHPTMKGYFMSQDKLAKLFEKQRKRQIAALLAVCSPEEKQRILADQEQRKALQRRVKQL
jgi:hypothetical protein